MTKVGKIFPWVILALVAVIFMRGTSGYLAPPPPPPPPPARTATAAGGGGRGAFRTVVQPPPPPPPKLFSRKRDMGGPWRGMMPRKICIDIT